MKTKDRAGAPAGNKNAVKAEEEKRTSMLYVPVTPREKAGVVRAAGGRPVAEYCRAKILS